jgi:hypothetical protein
LLREGNVGKAAGSKVSPDALMKFLLLIAFMTDSLAAANYEVYKDQLF